MPAARTVPVDSVEQRLDEIARPLALLVAGDRTLQDRIGEFNSAGFGPTRISELTGTSVGYAKTAIARAKNNKTS
jgi:hypothetical protein